jgi:hypothetical protein
VSYATDPPSAALSVDGLAPPVVKLTLLIPEHLRRYRLETDQKLNGYGSAIEELLAANAVEVE